MEKRKFGFDYLHYASLAELSAGDRELADRAFDACKMAFAPYSRFKVGAAARLADGQVIMAGNQESPVFPAGVCAERALLYHHQSHRPNHAIVALAVASDPAQRECRPCGICRQTLVDTEERQGTPIRIIMVGPDSATEVGSAKELLPFHFEM